MTVVGGDTIVISCNSRRWLYHSYCWSFAYRCRSIHSSRKYLKLVLAPHILSSNIADSSP